MDKNNPSKLGCLKGISDDAKVALNKICTIIADTIETDAVYCLGYRNTVKAISTGIFIEENQSEHIHFYLVVFVKKLQKNSLMKLNRQISKNIGSQAAATLLLHSTASLHEVTKSQHYFFYRLFEQGNIVYQNKEVQSILNVAGEPKQSYDDNRIYLYTRNTAALDYLEALAAIEKNGSTMPGAVLMHLAVENICLMLIQSLLGYHSQKFSTKYLFELCDYATAIAKEIFPRNTPHEQELFKTLCIRPGMVRHRHIDAVPYSDLQIVASRCREFQCRAFKIALEKIELLIQNEISWNTL
jgi:hypothetical protein